MGAMYEEVAPVINDTKNRTQENVGIRTYHSGTLCGKDVVIAFSGWGKVASASTVTTLLVHYGVEAVLLFGVAGAASPDLNVGDIIVAKELIQHDLDPSPIFPKYQVPLLGISRFETDTHLRSSAITAAKKFVSSDIFNQIDRNNLAKCHITKPVVNQGLIASGDQFISNPDVLAKLRSDLTGLQCIEMEGASVAQVCCEHKVPLAVIRVISDKADQSAHENFSFFVSNVINHYSQGIIRNFLTQI
jgi:adenosylhomocysteine nucleosidase